MTAGCFTHSTSSAGVSLTRVLHCADAGAAPVIAGATGSSPPAADLRYAGSAGDLTTIPPGRELSVKFRTRKSQDGDGGLGRSHRPFSSCWPLVGGLAIISTYFLSIADLPPPARV